MILWSYDPKTDTYTFGNMNEEEVSTLVAAIIAGVAISGGDTFGAEAARRNLITYSNAMGDPEYTRLLEVVIAADAHRIHKRERANK